MKIFICWSGKKSKKAAKALKNWLPKVIQDADPWMSAKDIPAGKNPLEEISIALKQARYGVICITADNLMNPWIIYEASALYNNGIDVCPYVVDLNIQRGTLPSPLLHMQAEMADLEGTEQLVLGINNALENPVTNIDTIITDVHSNWEDLEKELERIRYDDSLSRKKETSDFRAKQNAKS